SSSNSSQSCLFSFVHASCSAFVRQDLWSNLEREGGSSALPWFVAGDNVISDNEEQSGRTTIDQAAMQQFNIFQNRAGLSDAGF
ncbi:hypothetical protein, partial [Klebsiella pneumoniae]|uniref:hypothetical protein n=1 Tax=Klebsiella pneumoniae TaxID=573 RepID=UPI00301390A3